MEPFLGQVQAFGFQFSPQGWANCAGQLMSISQNTALFALLGTTYGGNGQVTFGLPDLRGRTIRHSGGSAGPGLPYVNMGEVAGTESVSLSSANVPPHTHAAMNVAVNTANGNSDNSTLTLAACPLSFSEDVTAGANLKGVTGGIAGQGIPFAIRNPYLVMNVCIALEGIFPSRN